ncbi:MAG: hypothetical protein LBC41_02520 [Clostridiales bacterium]|nr:hypothetical protein [Clostridiales bacterium]
MVYASFAHTNLSFCFFWRKGEPRGIALRLLLARWPLARLGARHSINFNRHKRILQLFMKSATMALTKLATANEPQKLDIPKALIFRLLIFGRCAQPIAALPHEGYLKRQASKSRLRQTAFDLIKKAAKRILNMQR